MRTIGSKHSTPREEFGHAVSQALSTNKFIFRFLGISFLVFFALGILVYMIAFSLFYGFVKLAFVLDPVYQIFVRLIRIDGLPSRLVKPSTGQAIYAWVSLIFPALFVYVGVRLLLMIGFASQNMLWILSRVFSIIMSR